jgi:xanthine/CO dehydrogenase XdhC/CoxF family maturation factor
MTRIARYWRAQPVYLTLLLAALLMRGLIPAGYMPAPGHGLFALELCTAEQYRPPARGSAEKHGTGDSGASASHFQRHDATDAAKTPQREHALFGYSPLVDAGAHYHSSTSLDASPSTASAPHHQHHGATNPAGHESPCPFAATAVCAPAPVVLTHAVAFDASPVRAIREPQVHTPSIVARSQGARAPPTLS